MRKVKKKSIAKLVDEAAVRLQLYVRLEQADSNGYVSCVTCGVTRHYKDRMQGGHFIPRGRTSTKLLRENVNPQCDTCNGPCGTTAAGNPIAYTLYMQVKYGKQWVEDIIIKSNEVKKYSRSEVNDYIREIKNMINIEQKRVGI